MSSRSLFKTKIQMTEYRCWNETFFTYFFYRLCPVTFSLNLSNLFHSPHNLLNIHNLHNLDDIDSLHKHHNLTNSISFFTFFSDHFFLCWMSIRFFLTWALIWFAKLAVPYKLQPSYISIFCARNEANWLNIYFFNDYNTDLYNSRYDQVNTFFVLLFLQ